MQWRSEVRRRKLGILVAGGVALLLLVAPRSSAHPATATSTFAVAGPSFRGTSTPTGTKRAETPVWWNDDSWWASMWSNGRHAFHIFRFVTRLERWVDTGTAIDDRPNTAADALSDGKHVYIASHKRVRDLTPATSGSPTYFYRFSYIRRAHEYELDRGFPTMINDYRTETVVVAEDSRGRIWATWQQGDRIMVAHTVRRQRGWSVSPLPFPQAETTVDDISAVVAFSHRIGIMWSNQSPALDGMYFSTHADDAAATAWTEPELALAGPREADDHINLKADSSGVVYAAVKTSSIHKAPLTLLLVRRPSGVWTSTLFGTADECHNRPVVVLDERHDLLHMFAAGPSPETGACTSAGGAIYEKTSPLDKIAFAPGEGQLVLDDPAAPFITNIATGKQPLPASAGTLLLAVNTRTALYRTFYSR